MSFEIRPPNGNESQPQMAKRPVTLRYVSVGVVRQIEDEEFASAPGTRTHQCHVVA